MRVGLKYYLTGEFSNSAMLPAQLAAVKNRSLQVLELLGGVRLGDGFLSHFSGPSIARDTAYPARLSDSHMLAADDGSHSDYATGGGAPLPVMCAAPLDQEPSLKGGYYSQGVYRVRKGEGCFGLLTVTEKGDAIDVAYSGRNYKNEEKISLKFSVLAPKTVAQR
jgi:hypothetical protein